MSFNCPAVPGRKVVAEAYSRPRWESAWAKVIGELVGA